MQILKNKAKLLYCIISLSMIYTLSLSGFETKPLNILFIANFFPKISETFILNQITGLIDQGHQVWIYTLQRDDPAIVHEDFITYNLNERIVFDDIPFDEKQQFFEQHSFDIIYCHFGTRGFTAQKLINTFGLDAKLIAVFHGFDITKVLKNDPTIYDTLLPDLDLALAISDCWKKRLITLGLPDHKIKVHHMGINPDTFAFKARTHDPQKPIRFISIARFVEKKGLSYALQAFAAVEKKYKNVEYYIIGDGKLKNKLKVLTYNLNISNKVHFLGWQPQEKVIEALYDSDILLAPSVTAQDGDQEGIPVSLIEAMAMGIPVISTYHSGIPELVEDGISGLLVPEKESSALEKAMIQLIEYPETWPLMGQAGRSYVEKEFNIHTLNKKLNQLFTNVCTSSNK